MDDDTTPLGPHWWDEFNAPRSQPVARTPRPRWPLIFGALLLVSLLVVFTYPSIPSLTGN